ncbi:type IV secretory system conjugative DNA transfer family protein [Microlunatus soli]|uniref:Type IV secretory pathway, VirD4 component, TraG/TraD family ATPase n=1 Tax=Microlunatus soli TaxID=630515 RepID=A0A1H1UGR1_9ACTN|nr:TraM recognition domain-containing protein [Microlunatus soli]SDS71724.1 Type IV secretory pathway, VirD4 component, TraG/TraD family ATPase [Microlunatus soli]
MSRPSNRRRDPGGLSGEMILAFVGLGLLTAIVGICYLGVRVGNRIDGVDPAIPDDPFGVFFGLIRGDVGWPASGDLVLIAAGLLLIIIAAAGFLLRRRLHKPRSRVDRSAGYLGRGADIAGLSRRSAERKSDRLGVDGSPGVPIGRTVTGDHELVGSWEDMHIDVWGPRTGKTTSRAIPAILDAPGAVLVTSNKRDVVDATRDVRAADGPVWVFDPQQIAEQEPDWWWDPLSYVTDEVQAARLAGHFAAGSREPGAKTDAFFDPAGQDLLAGLLLAAACERKPITQVYSWVTRPTDETPVDILRDHDFPLTADQVSGVVTAPERQRGGIYGTAQQMAACLTNRKVARWITAGPGDQRRAFDPGVFVRSGGTLYSLSKEGKGTAGPLVTALTVAVVEAAEQLATRSPNGRLPVPLLGVLDEAANVCRWSDLPDLYSHYGSRGIVLMTILQSWSQGVDVWGESGMKKLWSAANIKVYGGGVAEAQFLEDLSKIVGDYDRLSSSASVTKGQRTVSQQLQRERILDIADLASMPQGRALVIASGSRPTLVRTVPWMSGPYASRIRDSIAAHGPRRTTPSDPEPAEVERTDLPSGTPQQDQQPQGA